MCPTAGVPQKEIVAVAISDTHTLHRRITLPPGDLLIHSGDFTSNGTVEEIARFNNWLGEQPFRWKIVVAGNHDWLFEKQNLMARSILTNAIYLQDSMVTIEGRTIYGAPWQPEYCNWAFNLPRGEEIKKKWDQIPEGLDLLITHGPTYGILDGVPEKHRSGDWRIRHCGCEELGHAVARVKPRFHVFGHIHAGYGRFKNDMTEFVNASICDEAYRTVNAPQIILL